MLLLVAPPTLLNELLGTMSQLGQIFAFSDVVEFLVVGHCVFIFKIHIVDPPCTRYGLSQLDFYMTASPGLDFEKDVTISIPQSPPTRAPHLDCSTIIENDVWKLWRAAINSTAIEVESQSVSVKSPLEKIPTLIIEPVIEPKQLLNAFNVLGSRDPVHMMSVTETYEIKTLKGLACFTAYGNYYFHSVYKGRDFLCEKEAKDDIAKVKSDHLVIQFDIIFD